MPASKDITGMRSGRLVAVRPTNKRRGNRGVIWECRCECGRTHYTMAYRIINKSVKSCGCRHIEQAKKAAFKLGLLKKKDITGQVFGKLTALECTGKKKYSDYIWKLRCDCGKTINRPICQVLSGGTRSCGCLVTDIHSLKIEGRRFGRLTALTRDGHKSGSITWKCQCDCGELASITATRLASGHTKSCGCLNDATRFVQFTNINPMNVPFAVTDTMNVRRELKKAIKQVS